MHALMTAILLGMARLDPFDADPEPEPPDRQFAQVEQSVSGSEGNTVIAAVLGGIRCLERPGRLSNDAYGISNSFNRNGAVGRNRQNICFLGGA